MDYIAHVCLNVKLPKEHLDYCDRGFVDICPTKETCTEQCWKYCKSCENKGYPVITEKPKKILSEKQKEVLRINRFKLQEKNK